MTKGQSQGDKNGRPTEVLKSVKCRTRHSPYSEARLWNRFPRAIPSPATSTWVYAADSMGLYAEVIPSPATRTLYADILTYSESSSSAEALY